MAKATKKRGRGRPPLDNPEEVRDRELRIRVNAEEERVILEAANGNLSAWAREQLLRLARRAVG